MHVYMNYDGCPYLTPEKRYTLAYDGIYPFILDDHGKKVYINLESCPHIEGYKWHIVS